MRDDDLRRDDNRRDDSCDRDWYREQNECHRADDRDRRYSRNDRSDSEIALEPEDTTTHLIHATVAATLYIQTLEATIN